MPEVGRYRERQRDRETERRDRHANKEIFRVIYIDK